MRLSDLPEVPFEMKVVWREAADPYGYVDDEGRTWYVFRQDGRLVRSLPILTRVSAAE